jgi:hypothetical protein
MMHKRSQSQTIPKDFPVGDDLGETKRYLERLETQDDGLGQIMEVVATPEEERRVVRKLDMMFVTVPVLL